MRKVDRYARDVAHIVLEDIQRHVSDRLDDFTITQTDGTSAREIRIRELTTLNHDAAREFEDRIGSRVGSARLNRVVDLGLIETYFRGHSRVPAQAVSAQIALGDR